MVSRPQVTHTRRNATAMGLTSVGVVGLFLVPTSTTSAGALRKPGQPLAVAGVVTDPGRTASPAPGAAAPKTLVVNGASVDTQFGPVQVQIRVRAGRIVAATAIDYPQSSGRDAEINGYAIPVLQQETVRAQSGRVDTVSGATYTSQGYVASLQSALDAAHLP
jgi:uncharacterized protein with FMN-binding domain